MVVIVVRVAPLLLTTVVVVVVILKGVCPMDDSVLLEIHKLIEKKRDNGSDKSHTQQDPQITISERRETLSISSTLSWEDSHREKLPHRHHFLA